jgi:hypothetical protein
MDEEWKIGCPLAALAVLLILAGGWIGACQEAKTYNKITGADVTTWDALWVELRIQESPR